MTDRPAPARSEGPLIIPARVAFAEATFGLAAGLILFLLMTITVVDVIGRYLFNAPLPAGYELVQISMGLMVFAALPLCTARDEQIRVEVFQLIFPRNLRAAMDRVSLLISIIVIGGFTWLLLKRAESFVESKETTPNLEVPLAPLAYVMSSLWAVCAVIAIVQFLQWRQAAQKAGAS